MTDVNVETVTVLATFHGFSDSSLENFK